MTQQPFRQLMTAGQIVHFTKGSLLKMRRLLSRAQTSQDGEGENSFITHSDDSFPPKSHQFAVQPWATP